MNVSLQALHDQLKSTSLSMSLETLLGTEWSVECAGQLGSDTNLNTTTVGMLSLLKKQIQNHQEREKPFHPSALGDIIEVDSHAEKFKLTLF